MSCSFASSDFCYSRLLEEETILNSTSFFFTTVGRVAQLAVIGYIVPEIFRWGFDIAPGVACADVPNGVAAIDAIPALGWAQMIFLIGAVDYWGVLGDFGFGKVSSSVDISTFGISLFLMVLLTLYRILSIA